MHPRRGEAPARRSGRARARLPRRRRARARMHGAGAGTGGVRGPHGSRLLEMLANVSRQMSAIEASEGPTVDISTGRAVQPAVPAFRDGPRRHRKHPRAPSSAFSRSLPGPMDIVMGHGTPEQFGSRDMPQSMRLPPSWDTPALMADVRGLAATQVSQCGAHASSFTVWWRTDDNTARANSTTPHVVTTLYTAPDAPCSRASRSTFHAPHCWSCACAADVLTGAHMSPCCQPTATASCRWLSISV